MPVLTEQAIEGASLIKNCQVLVTIFRSRRIGKIRITTSAASGTDPVGNTIGGEGIKIPIQISLFRTAAYDASTFVSSDSAVSNPALLDLTAVDTKVTTLLTFFSRRLGWQIEGFSALSVNLQDMGVNLPEMFADAA
jgi:hypothetical protein